VHEFVSVAKSQGQIESQGISSALSLLVYGPPGTGKTRLARYIASELGLELYVARLDGLISSFLGSTSKNIRALFDYASRAPCVLFLDEFDAIAKLRGDAQELGELKRVVNSFIQNLDTIGEHTITVAATNHEMLLDNAVWRRFSYRLELSYPDAELRRRMWEQFLPVALTRKKDLLALVDLSDGFSGADVQEVCLRVRRKQISTKTAPTLGEIFAALRNIAIGEGQERRVVISTLKCLSSPEVASALRERNPGLYSAEVIARLLSVAKATGYRWATRKVIRNG
jgi:SpoVK/Ycf46/Vps4 family AAA+-type ATPase